MSNHRLLNTHAEARKSAEKQSPKQKAEVGGEVVKRGGWRLRRKMKTLARQLP